MQSLRGLSASTGFGNPSYHFGSFLAYVSRRMPYASGLRAVGSLLASLVTSRQLALAVGSLLASLVTSRQPAAPRARLPAALGLHLPPGVGCNSRGIDILKVCGGLEKEQPSGTPLVAIGALTAGLQGSPGGELRLVLKTESAQEAQ